jgi:prophage regulatory protein
MTSPTLLRLNRVREITGLGTTYIYALMGEGHFPQPIRVGRRAVRWLQEEVHDWIVKRAAAPRAVIRTHVRNKADESAPRE